MAAKYETTVTLPTNGFLYEDGPVDVTIRAMTTQDEKTLYGSTSGDDKIRSIIKSCVVSPPDIDIDSLIPADMNFLLMKLRIHTYGPEYRVEVPCPYCHHDNNMTINLNDLLVNELTEDFKEPIHIKLPMSGDEIDCKLLRVKDNNFVTNLAKKIARNSKLSVDEIAYTYRMAKEIVKLNGKEIDFGDAQKYVQEMHARDSAYIRSELRKIQIGFDQTLMVESCAECGEYFEVPMPVTSEFFRPTFD